jgi:hypothetical protein
MGTRANDLSPSLVTTSAHLVKAQPPIALMQHSLVIVCTPLWLASF